MMQNFQQKKQNKANLTDIRPLSRAIQIYSIARSCLNGAEIAAAIGFSIRSIYRWKKKLKSIEIEKASPKIFMHASAGRIARNRINREVEQKAKDILKEVNKKIALTPILAHDILISQGFTISKETTRVWMIETNLWDAVLPKHYNRYKY